MGWTGTYDRSIKTIQDRKRFILNEFNQENRIIDIAYKGTTFYCAYKQNDNQVIGLVILTEKNGDEFLYKEMTENSMPYKFDCPKRIINKLTPTDNELANTWRKKCLENKN
jgi:hypothetical protein